jgi:ABC-type multidrug transport system ATPase subunit
MLTETPTELFRFATRFTSNFDKETVEIRVQTLIARLGLDKCKDTIVGGFYVKGLSGGERKRTSIGFELVTNPRVLLLDEPTSGLDSSTAFSIGKLLKKEAERGMGIMATVHSPGSELFKVFDRCIVMAVGYTVYNGPVEGIANYFTDTLNVQIPPFTNYADYLILLATHPSLIGLEKTTVRALHKRCAE